MKINGMNTYCSPIEPNVLVQQSLDLKLRTKIAHYHLKCGAVNAVILSLLIFDIYTKCPSAECKLFYSECALSVVVALSLLASFLKYFLFIFFKQPVHGTEEQKHLLKFDDNDNSFITNTSSDEETDTSDDGGQEEFVNSPILSWHSCFKQTRGAYSRHWSYSRIKSLLYNYYTLNARNQEEDDTLFISPHHRYSDEQITDENSLRRYLRNVSRKEYSLAQIPRDYHEFYSNGTSLSSFWNYCYRTANLLKTSLYQLAPSPAPITQNKQTTNEESGLNIIYSNSIPYKMKPISSEKLTQYVGNLRKWISFTILQRLTKEIGDIDESFQQRGFHDMQIGGIGLERLKKTVESQQFISLYMPMLPMIVPFLEMSSNQEYLVQRIKDLAKGSCIADYRWNSGAEYHGLKWDEHLPTDSAILFHLFCVYLDTQLMPLPQGCGRPFYSRYVIIGEAKCSCRDIVALVQNKAHCAILCTNPLKPVFNFISNGEIHNCAYDRNNLFHVIIQFLIYMRNYHESTLEGVNLGKSGINIMCTIEN